MPQKKVKKKTNKKSRKHTQSQKQINQTIIHQAIPNYSSSQVSGHQYNNNRVQFAPAMQQQSRTDNLVGDLVGKLITKIESDGNQQTQQYSKEILPVNNSNSGNNSVVNIYTDGTKKEEKKTDETIGSTISEGIKSGTGTAIGTAVSTITGATEAPQGLGAGPIAGIVTGGLLVAGGLIANRGRIGRGIQRASNSVRSRFGGQRLGRGYNGLDRPPPIGAAFEEVPEARRVSTELQTGSRVGTDLQTGSRRGTDNAALNARLDEHLRRIRDQVRPIEEAISTSRQQSRPPTRPPSIADENAPLLIAQPPLSARSNSSRSSSSSSSRNLINASPAARSPILEAGITYAPTQRARTSGVQEHSGVSTRNTRAQTGEPHTQLSQTREYHRSDDKEYRKGQRHRLKHDNLNRPRPLVEVLNPDNPYNQGYFGDALKQDREGYYPREVKSGRPRSTMLSQVETPEPAAKYGKK